MNIPGLADLEDQATGCWLFMIRRRNRKQKQPPFPLNVTLQRKAIFLHCLKFGEEGKAGMAVFPFQIDCSTFI